MIIRLSGVRRLVKNARWRAADRGSDRGVSYREHHFLSERRWGRLFHCIKFMESPCRELVDATRSIHIWLIQLPILPPVRLRGPLKTLYVTLQSEWRSVF